MLETTLNHEEWVQKLKKLLVESPELTEPKLVDELVRRTTTT